MHKLNFGCGKDIKEGWDNMDITPWGGTNIVRDFRRGIPRNDNYYTEILAQYSLTQIQSKKDFIFVMNELHRVLEKTGILKIKVPNARHEFTDSFNDPMDCRYFTKETFDYFNIDHPYRWNAFNYGIEPWHEIKIEECGEKKSRLYVEMRPYKV